MTKAFTANFKGKKVLISAGGTGGHVYPALAVARRLSELGAQIEWLGTQAGIESRLVPEAGIPLHTIFVQGLRGNGLKRLIKAPWVIVSAVFQAKKVLKKINPDVFIGFGGFASGPGALAAKLCAVPVIVHEQNAAMGLTNKIVTKWAKKTLLAFPIAGRNYPVVGNPIRQAIAGIDLPQQRMAQTEPFRVLIVGGSLGARAINQVIPDALAPLLDRVTVLHQTGKTTYAETIDAYKNKGLLIHPNIRVVEYIDDMKAAYEQADLLIARAGALTVSEVASVGLAAIFIPLPHAVDNHQYLNAQFLAKVFAAKIIEEKSLSSASLNRCVETLLNGEILTQMASNGRAVSHAEALDKIVAIIHEVIHHEQ